MDSSPLCGSVLALCAGRFSPPCGSVLAVGYAQSWPWSVSMASSVVAAV